MIRGQFKTDFAGAKALISEAKARNITLKGAKAGGKLLVPPARAAAPKRKRSGALKQSQGMIAKKGRKGSTISFAVQGAKKKTVKMVKLPGYRTPQKVVPAFYDHLVQLGTKPHSLKKGAKLSRNRIGRFIQRQIGSQNRSHPGAKANPYRKQAWERVKYTAGQAAVKAMGEELTKILAKQKAKYG